MEHMSPKDDLFQDSNMPFEELFLSTVSLVLFREEEMRTINQELTSPNFKLEVCQC